MGASVLGTDGELEKEENMSLSFTVAERMPPFVVGMAFVAAWSVGRTTVLHVSEVGFSASLFKVEGRDGELWR